MSFYDIETGLSALLQGVDRRKDDRAALALKLKAKLRELRACGVIVEVDDDLVETANAKPAAPTATQQVI